jgi:urease accessory protein
MATMDDTGSSNRVVPLLRLMQIVSPALPIGAYAYSHGLEYAVSAGFVRDEMGTRDWILGIMEHAVSALDVPVLARLYRAWQTQDEGAVSYWNGFLNAARESAELQSEDSHLGRALARLLADQGISEARAWASNPSTCLATAFALAAVRWQIDLHDAASGYVFSWCENQVAAALKLVPLGQTAGQRILTGAIARIVAAVERGLDLEDDAIGLSAPGLAIVSILHETQYSRLFRS